MTTRYIRGIKVPEVASPAKFRGFIHAVYVACGENYAETARAIGGNISPATIWKLEEGKQKDSPAIRKILNTRKCAPRPRAEIRTNNLELAINVFLTHYPECQIISPNGRIYSRRQGKGSDNSAG
jgi:hypothetical protein